MSAPEREYDNQRRGTAGAGHASGAATGQARSYGMGAAVPASTPYGTGPAPSGGYAGAVAPAGACGMASGQTGYGSHPAYGQPQVQPQAQVQPGYAYPISGHAVAAGYQVPPTSVPQQMPQKKRRRGVVIAIIIAICAIAAAILLAFTLCADEKSRRQGDAGQLEGKTDAEIQAELDRVVEEGMFNISIASVIELESGTSEGDLRIENVPGNRYLMRVSILRNDTGEELYRTDVIEPNHHIQRDAFDVALPAGSYECTALFEALDPATEEQVGQAAAIITVNVRS